MAATDQPVGAEGRTTLGPVVLFTLIVLLWGSTWIFIKLQLGSVAPAVSVAYRFLLAAACIFAWCAAGRIRLRFPAWAHLRFALVGLLQYCVNYVLVYYSSEHLVSGLVSIIFSLSIACNIVNGYLFLGRRVQPSVVLAALAGVFGLVLVFWDEIVAAGGGGVIVLGVSLAFGGALSFSFANIISTKNQQAELPVVPATAWSMLYGGLLTTVGCVITGQEFTVELSTRYLISLGYLAVCGSAIAFVAYLTLMGKIGPDRAAFAPVVFPLVSLTLSTLFEGYQWSVLALFGAALILVANAAILAGPQLRAALRPRGA